LRLRPIDVFAAWNMVEIYKNYLSDEGGAREAKEKFLSIWPSGMKLSSENQKLLDSIR
jgi:hypothetical protein